MKPEPYILLKDKVTQFCQLNHRDWELLREIFVLENLKKGELFASEEKKAERFGFVYLGCLRMSTITEYGKDLTKHFLRSGDFFVGALNYGEKNSVSIQALNDCEILSTDFNKLEELSKAYRFVSDFKNNLISKYVQIKLVRENNYLNIEALDRYKLFLENFPNLLNQIPLHYIASYLGISDTQLSRIRKKMFAR